MLKRQRTLASKLGATMKNIGPEVLQISYDQTKIFDDSQPKNKFQSFLDNSKSKFNSIDKFGEGFHMKIDKGHSIMLTSVGSIFTFILFIIVGLYTYQKTNIMIGRTDDHVMTSIQDSFFDLDYKFDYKHGLNIAAALTAFDDEKENTLSPDIGRIVFKQYHWGVDTNEKYFVTTDYLPAHVCSK